jgi:threonine dehydratase
MITLHDIQEAQERIRAHLLETPCVFSSHLSEKVGARVYLKLENAQRTGSFKERGALNRLLSLSESEKKRGVVTASAGNHAQAVAYHATKLGIVSTIFMPQCTPIIKATRTEGFGANVRFVGENYDDTQQAALEYAVESGAVYVHAYDDDLVIAGQGTLALELMTQIPDLDVMVTPVGGGGLIAGIAMALNALKPSVRVVGVEPGNLMSMKSAIDAHALVSLPAAATLADGIRVRRVGHKTYEICSKLVHEWAGVSDDEIARAILFLLEEQKTIAEGAGAAGVAALFDGRIKDLKNKTICVVIGGGNIDANLLSQVIERGMIESGRLVKLAINLHDRPGELGELLTQIGKARANVMEVHHERAFGAAIWNDVEVDLVLETRGKKHIAEILSLIRSKGYAVLAKGSQGEG